jgi:hypothetical protein
VKTKALKTIQDKDRMRLAGVISREISQERLKEIERLFNWISQVKRSEVKYITIGND